MAAEYLLARETFKKNVDTFLAQNGIDADRLTALNRTFVIGMEFGDEAREQIPAIVTQFANSLYGSRRVKILDIILDHDEFAIQVYPEDTFEHPPEIKDVVINDTGLGILTEAGREAIQQDHYEAKLKWGEGIYVPEEEAALSRWIGGDLTKTPLTYELSGRAVPYMKDWIIDAAKSLGGIGPGEPPHATEPLKHGELSPAVVIALSTLIPDSPTVIAERKKGYREQNLEVLFSIPLKRIMIFPDTYADDKWNMFITN